MKINLECGNNVIEGYQNTDTGSLTADGRVPDGVRRVRIDDLTFCPDGVAEEIMGIGVPNIIPIDRLENALSHWYKKLAVGGQLYLVGTDAEMLGHDMANGYVDLASYNQLIYGSQQRQNKALYSLHEVMSAAAKVGFMPGDRGYQGTSFYVRLYK